MKKNLLFLFLFVSLITNAQERLLSGKVVNQSNEPLSGASVIVKGLNKGVATDDEGNEYPTHGHAIVKLGHIVLEQG